MSEARIRSISGPVLHASSVEPFRVGEAVEVGRARLPGEIIRLDGDSFVAQVYEDTTGLKPGDPVYGTGAPLSVPLGPGLLGRIYDGLLRRLDADEHEQPDRFDFMPAVSVGDTLAPGAVIGEVEGSAHARLCMLPPHVGGVVVARP